MFQNMESNGLSPTGPVIFSLHRRMFGSGSSGRLTWSCAMTWSACFEAAMRSLWTMLVSTVDRSGSRVGMLMRCQFWPPNLFAFDGMFFEHAIEQRPGFRLVAVCAYRVIW